MLGWISVGLLLLGLVCLAMAVARPNARPVRRYDPFYSDDEWVEIEPHFNRIFEGRQ